MISLSTGISLLITWLFTFFPPETPAHYGRAALSGAIAGLLFHWWKRNEQDPPAGSRAARPLCPPKRGQHDKTS